MGLKRVGLEHRPAGVSILPVRVAIGRRVDLYTGPLYRTIRGTGGPPVRWFVIYFCLRLCLIVTLGPMSRAVQMRTSLRGSKYSYQTPVQDKGNPKAVVTRGV